MSRANTFSKSPQQDRVAYSIAEFCSATGISRSRVYTEIRLRRLKTVKCGRRTLIPANELQAWLDRLFGLEA